jgi:BirA family biotin operon repressor/biotin-[acetyl-CoA-carboxylase] ligase
VEGAWLVALVQDGGRGRQGRSWASTPGNFHGSTVVHLRADDPPAPTLALAAGLAMMRAVEVAAPATGLMLKWPIDLWLESAHVVGTPISVHASAGERMEGAFAGLAEDGALQLRLADGSSRVIHAADVQIA